MATLYCGPASTGSGSGADFNNLLALPNTTGFVRGNTYIVVDGSYGSKTLSTSASGSTTITIKKASAADSAVAGYSSTLHDGQASFGGITVATGYWLVDGVTRTETNILGAQPAGYGMAASSISANSNDGQNAVGSVFSYIDIGAAWNIAPSSGTISGYDSVIYMVYNQAGVTFNRCAIHNGKGALVFAHGSGGLTFDHCDFGPGWGKEAIAGPNVGINNLIVRYSRFYDSTQTDPNDGTSGITAEIGAFGGSDPTGNLIYGNIFYNTKSGGRNACIFFGGGGWPDSAQSCKVFNNTFVDVDESAVYGMILLSGGSGNEARNNLFYSCGSTGVSANSSSNNVVASVDPFVDYAGRDFRITSSNQARNAGTALASTYNTDPLGVTRGADGTWDVGAYEYDAGGGGGAASSIVRPARAWVWMGGCP